MTSKILNRLNIHFEFEIYRYLKKLCFPHQLIFHSSKRTVSSIYKKFYFNGFFTDPALQ